MTKKSKKGIKSGKGAIELQTSDALKDVSNARLVADLAKDLKALGQNVKEQLEMASKLTDQHKDKNNEEAADEEQQTSSKTQPKKVTLDLKPEEKK